MEELAEALTPAPYGPREVITRQGDPSDCLFLMVSGSAAVEVGSDGLARKVAELHGGSVFGEMGVLTGEPRSATVTAMTQVECWRMDRTHVEGVIKARPRELRPRRSAPSWPNVRWRWRRRGRSSRRMWRRPTRCAGPRRTSSGAFASSLGWGDWRAPRGRSTRRPPGWFTSRAGGKRRAAAEPVDGVGAVADPLMQCASARQRMSAPLLPRSPVHTPATSKSKQNDVVAQSSSAVHAWPLASRRPARAGSGLVGHHHGGSIKRAKIRARAAAVGAIAVVPAPRPGAARDSQLQPDSAKSLAPRRVKSTSIFRSARGAHCSGVCLLHGCPTPGETRSDAGARPGGAGAHRTAHSCAHSAAVVRTTGRQGEPAGCGPGAGRSDHPPATPGRCR